MKKIYIITIGCLLSLSAIQAQKISFRQMYDQKQATTRATEQADDAFGRLDLRSALGELDSSVCLTADKKPYRKLEFVRDDQGRATTKALSIGGTTTRWQKSIRYDYVYAADNSVKEETTLLGIDNEWVNDLHYVYGKGEEAYEKSEWKNGKWQPDSKVEYTFDKNESPLSKTYSIYANAAWTVTAKVAYTYNAAGMLATETLFQQDKEALPQVGTYTYAYDAATGKLSTVTYAKKDQADEWKEAYTYSGERTTVTTSRMENGKWETTNLLTFQKDEADRFLYFQNYQMENRVKKGTSYFERAYDPNGEEKSGAVYEWDATAGDWVNHKKISSELNPDGKVTLATTAYWKEGRWINNNQLKVTYNERGDIASSVLSGWQEIPGTFIPGNRWTFYYNGIATSNEVIADAAKPCPFEITGRTIRLLPEATAKMSVFGLLGEAKSLNTNQYTVPMAGCYLVKVGSETYKLFIH